MKAYTINKKEISAAKIILIIAMTFSLGLLLQSCGGGGGGTASTESAPALVADVEDAGTITGVIENTLNTIGTQRVAAKAAGRQGVAGARVYAFPAGTASVDLVPNASVPAAVTDENGAYTIEKVKSGSYVLVVDADNNGQTDRLMSGVSVEKGKTCDVGSKALDELEAAPGTDTDEDTGVSQDPIKDNNDKDTGNDLKYHQNRPYYCNITLDRVRYASGDTMVISVAIYNGTDADVKCGVRVNLKKGGNHPEMWRSDFVDADYFVAAPANSVISGTIKKVIPPEWANTNSVNGSDYHVYPIQADGTIVGKGDNFNILYKTKCINADKCEVDDGDDDSDTGSGDTGGDVTPPPPPPAPAIICYTDADCDDFSTYSIDKCINPGTPESYCEWWDF